MLLFRSSDGLEQDIDIPRTPELTRHLMPGILTRNSWISLIQLDTNEVNIKLEELAKQVGNISLAIVHHQSENEMAHDLLNLLNDISANIIVIKSDLQSLLYDIPLTRRKRSLCGTCGKILNLLFGVSTEDHAKEVEEKLENYQNKMSKTITIIDEQLTIIDSNEKRIIFNEQRIKNLQKITKELSTYVNKIVRGNIQKTMQNLQKTVNSIDILSIIVTIQEDLSKLRTATIAAKDNNIQRSLIPDHIFSIIIKEMVIAAPKVAILNKNQINEARSISDIRITRQASILRIWIYTPLNELQERVDFYETNFLPVPTSMPGVFAQIAEETKYFAVSKSGSLYQQIEPGTFKRCKPIRKNELLCASSNSYKRQPLTVCPWLVMNELVDRRLTCKIRYFSHFEAQVKKVAEGRYIYSVPEATSLDIRCPQVHRNKRIQIEGIGLLQLENSCSATSKSMFFPATFIQNETKIYNIPTKFNMSSVIQRIPDLDIFKIPDFNMYFNKTKLLPHPTEATILKEKLRQLKSENHPLTTVHNYKGIIFTILVLCLAIMGKFSWKFMSKFRPRRASQEFQDKC